MADLSQFDLTAVGDVLLERLGVTGWPDLDWLTEDEVFAYFDEAAKRLAEVAGVFAERDATTTLAAGQANYANPQGWIDSEHVSANGLRLRPASAEELSAVDATWPSTPGAPTRYSLDAGPLGTTTLYPAPQENQAGQPLAHVYHRFPADISATQTLVPLPAPVADYLLYFALQRARGKEGDGAMTETAAHCGERCKLYEQICAGYWGRGE